MSEQLTPTSPSGAGAPRRIGPYEVLETIGRGGMAAVYKAYQPSLDRTVAIKVISSHIAAEPEFIERFRQEARAIARLSHPNILIVHDFGEDNGIPYLVMELVEGFTLADVLERGITPQEIPDLVTQVASGLDYAHSRGIVHRDIKPQNVLVTPEGRAVLADFGLARMMENAQRLTMSGGIVGTPEYMSPEQAAGRPTDHRTDIYALGVMLYEMVAGLRPFTAETPLGVLMKHLQETPPPIRHVRPDLPPALDEVIQKALAKRPEDRYQTAGELVQAYKQALVTGPAARPAATGASPAAPPPAAPSAPPAGPQPPQLDLSRYAGLRLEAEKAVRPHETPSMARLRAAGQSAPPAGSLPQAVPAGPAPAPQARPCPECGTPIPLGDSMCPNCLYMLPFEDVASGPLKKEPERSEMRVNLQGHGLGWDPPGLERARQLAQQKVSELAAQGWELTVPVEFVQGRAARGPVVVQAILRLQRIG